MRRKKWSEKDLCASSHVRGSCWICCMSAVLTYKASGGRGTIKKHLHSSLIFIFVRYCVLDRNDFYGGVSVIYWKKKIVLVVMADACFTEESGLGRARSGVHRTLIWRVTFYTSMVHRFVRMHPVVQGCMWRFFFSRIMHVKKIRRRKWGPGSLMRFGPSYLGLGLLLVGASLANWPNRRGIQHNHNTQSSSERTNASASGHCPRRRLGGEQADNGSNEG